MINLRFSLFELYILYIYIYIIYIYYTNFDLVCISHYFCYSLIIYMICDVEF